MHIKDILNLPTRIKEIFKQEIYFETLLDRDEMIELIKNDYPLKPKDERVITFLKHEINKPVELYRQCKTPDGEKRLKHLTKLIWPTHS